MRYAKRSKAVSIISLFLIFMVLLSGCQSKESLTPADLTGRIQAQHTFPTLNSLSGVSLSSYFEFQDTDVKRFSVFISASAESADTIAAFEVTNEEQHKTVVSGISGYLSKLSSSFKNTMESEYQKIQNRILVEIDDVILLVICSEPDELEPILETLGAEPIY